MTAPSIQHQNGGNKCATVVTAMEKMQGRAVKHGI